MSSTISSKISKLDECPDDLSQAGHDEVCNGCSGQRLCQESFSMIDGDIEDIRVRMSVIKHKILVMSGKGGVGKSTFASTWAILLAKKGAKVGIVDLDICGPSIASMMNINEQKITQTPWGWKPCESPYFKIKVISVASLIEAKQNAVIYRGPRKTNLIKRILKETFWGRLDYLIFDTPPGTSDEHLTIIRFLKTLNPTGALIVSTPQKLSTNTIRKEITFCLKTKLNIIGLVENMSYFQCPCCEERTNLFPSSGIKEIAEENNVLYFGQLPFIQKLCKKIDTGESITDIAEISVFEDLIEQIQKKINSK